MKKYIIEDFYKNRPLRIYEDYAPCIRADRQGLKVVEEYLHIRHDYRYKTPNLSRIDYSLSVYRENGGE